jgi:peptidoglycan/xylan/chitin deacetylase (PgdA/CDA1 family)
MQISEWLEMPEILASITDVQKPQEAWKIVGGLNAAQRVALSDSLNFAFGRSPNAVLIHEKAESFWQTRIDELESDPTIASLRQNCAQKNLKVKWERREISSDKPIFLQYADLKVGEIAITFDDGPHPASTALVLQALAQAEVCCNFFQLGSCAQNLPAISRAVAESGHSVGSHSMSHSDLTKLSLAEAMKDIRAGREQIIASSGQNKPFFRCPYGAVNDQLRQAIYADGLFIFHWSMDPQEWDFKKTQYRLTKTFKAIIDEVERVKRGILLLHDVHRQVGLVLPDVLKYLAINDYTIVQFV